MVDDNTWPPEQPTNFTPLLLIYYRGLRTPEEVTAMAELMCTGKVASVTQHICSREGTRRLTKNIKEVLASLEESEQPFFVLIEGAPGIGKTVLLKEIAFKWGKKQLLQNFELVLLICLRDPSLQQIESVDDLLRLFYKRDKNAKEIVTICSESLSKNGGKNIVLLLDGYDEYPSDLQRNSLIADIIKRQVLPLCGLVI